MTAGVSHDHGRGKPHLGLTASRRCLAQSAAVRDMGWCGRSGTTVVVTINSWVLDEGFGWSADKPVGTVRACGGGQADVGVALSNSVRMSRSAESMAGSSPRRIAVEAPKPALRFFDGRAVDALTGKAGGNPRPGGAVGWALRCCPASTSRSAWRVGMPRLSEATGMIARWR